MTLSSSTSRNDYVGTGSVDTYPYTFRIFAATDLLVTVQDTAGAETTLSYLTDYTVTGVGSATGGDVVLTAGNLTSGYGITLRRVRPLTQTTDIRNQGAFYPEVHEDTFDHLTMVAQQHDDEIGRSLKIPETEAPTAAATTLPTADNRAEKVLMFNASGEPIAASVFPTSGVSITAFGESLIDDANAAAGRATLGIDGTSGVIATGDIANGAVIESKLGSSSVTETKIADGSITAAKLADGVITGDGFFSIPGTLTYASATSFTTSVDCTSLITIGTKIKLTNVTVKYFYVVAATSGSITVTGGSDYTLTNSSISNGFYSNSESPVGFPPYFNYVPTINGFSSSSYEHALFRISQRCVTVSIAFITGTSNTTGFTVTNPVQTGTTILSNYGLAFRCMDNGSYDAEIGYAFLVDSDSTISINRKQTDPGWTASGTKGTNGVLISYFI